MVNLLTKISVFVCFLLVSFQSSAGRVEGLYNVEIAVADESTVSRERAFVKGLDQVFIRISGDSIVMDKLKRPKASRYVKQFSYEPIPDPEPEKDGSVLTHHLKIQYNGSAMEKYLLDNGFAAWGEYRPDVVVWLVVRDGRSEYVLKNKDRSLLKEVAVEALERRGIPNRWPSYDAKDKNILSVSDIRGGFKEPVIEASQRYGRGPALTGSMIWNGRSWSSSWSLLLEGGNRHWNLDGADYSKMVNKAMDQAADALGSVFAVHTATDMQQLAKVSLDVQNVSSIEKFHFLESYLLGLSAVEKVKPSQADGQKVVVEVSLRSNEQDFLNLIKNDGQLSEVAAPDIPATLNEPPLSQPPLSPHKDTGAEIGKASTDLAPPLLLTDNAVADRKSTKKAGSESVVAEIKPAETVSKGPADAVNNSTAAKTDDNVSAAQVNQVATYYYRLNPPQ